MRVTDDMISAAAAVQPQLTLAAVKSMLEAALQGQIIFDDDAGKVISAGKAHWPVLLQINIADPLRALNYSQQLTVGALHKLEDPSRQFPITLILAGEAELSD